MHVATRVLARAVVAVHEGLVEQLLEARSDNWREQLAWHVSGAAKHVARSVA